jgi:hypothetical protein
MSPRVRRFARHYAEMWGAMLLGMLVLALPAEMALGALGSGGGEVQAEAPAVALLWMAASMTVPMVGWMAYRGHGRRANAEMAASMFLPTFFVIGLLAAGVVTDFGALMGFEHALMAPSMLIAMLLRVDEYAGHCAGTTERAVAA